MPWDLAVWLVICGAWLLFEFASLRRDDDNHYPFTFWTRRILSLERGPFSIGWWLAAGLIGWLAWHFLVEGVFLS